MNGSVQSSGCWQVPGSMHIPALLQICGDLQGAGQGMMAAASPPADTAASELIESGERVESDSPHPIPKMQQRTPKKMKKIKGRNSSDDF